jgi:spore maturation protein CgeB
VNALRFAFFAHSWISDWNHGNAHFLRGLVQELMRMGHTVRCYEERGSWSVASLVTHEGLLAQEAMRQFWSAFPQLDVRFYAVDDGLRAFLAEELRGTDIVVLHEWNRPELVNTVLSLARKLGSRVLFHDTHHRAYSSPGEILKFRLHLCDGVLAFGEAIRRIYAEAFGVKNVWTFHEAADTANFHPRSSPCSKDVTWVGNWGDEERSRELQEFLIGPAKALPSARFVVYGVRYPEEARNQLRDAGIDFRGYLPNLSAPRAYSESRVTLHVPRRQYANGLSGIPTIRVFEAMACGTPLLCSPWSDHEGLFRPGEDYVVAQDGRSMAAVLRNLLRDDKARQQIAASGLETIMKKHTCGHRARQLLDICEELGR